MKKLKLKNILSSTALIVGMIPLASMAGDNTYVPAKFDFNASDLAALVKVDPKKDFDSQLVVYCQSDIDTDGEALRVSCYDDHASDMERQTEEYITKLAFTPAKNEGEPIPVKMRFRVVYDQVDGKLNADLIPNLGTMQERYGLYYVAPQERLDVTEWYERYSKNSWVNGSNFFGSGDQVRVAATINTDGKANTIRPLDVDRAYKRDAKIVQNSLRKARFIPGFVNDRPVSMGYIAVVNYGDESQTAVSSR